ncbi:MAG: high-potential iron-sulfur protein [Chitinophagaceae bacterium]|nr:high-potential iron-sulfur protein [Chitinophagaceae bacterium]MCW5929084.1 high-potential iron-sulfur protein [Chitinophagaceae bacterium]
MKSHYWRRREFLKQVFQHASLFSIAIVLGCGGADNQKDATSEKPGGDSPAQNDDPCDETALTQKDLDHRKALGYTEQTPIPEKTCENCKLYIPESDIKKCGTCTLFKGPVTIEGYCTYWADKNV